MSSLYDTDSDLSSLGSSPPPPDSYLSPPATQASESDSSLSTPSRKRSGDELAGTDATRKKRKVAAKKDRTTRYLDLSSEAEGTSEDQAEELEILLKTLRKCRKIVVIAGAGISVSAGIPDFRSEDGLFNRLKKQHNLKASGKEMFDASVYRNDASTGAFHDMIRSLAEHSSKAKPTAFHHLLARLAKEKRLLRLYTQNVDEIDTSMPPLATSIPLGPKGPWPQTIQLHGGLRKMVCQKCRDITDLQHDLFRGPVPPLCPSCDEIDMVRKTSGQRSHGIGKLRPRMVLYNEHNPDEEAIGSVMMSDLRARPDAVIVVGTTLKIPGVKRFLRECVGVVRGRQNGVCMWINRDPVPNDKLFENVWDLVVKADCDEVARRAGLKQWDDDSDNVFDECTNSDVERVKLRQGKLEVVVTPRKTASFNAKTGMMTPSSRDEKQGKLSFIQKENLAKPEHAAAITQLFTKTATYLTEGMPAKKSKARASMAGKKATAKESAGKKATTKKPTKAAVAKKAAAPKIDSRFKVAKAAQTSSKGTKASTNIGLEITGIKAEPNDGQPMSSLSPTAARANGPMDTSSPAPAMPAASSTSVSPQSLKFILN